MGKSTQNQVKTVQPRSSPAQSRPKVSSLEFLGLAVFVLLPLTLPAIWSGQLQSWLPTQLRAYFSAAPQLHQAPPAPANNPPPKFSLEACQEHKYTSEIVSLDPLVIYINNFTSPTEAEDLITAGTPDFEDSFISRSHGGLQKVPGRTSQSAPLDPALPLVQCVLSRARTFMGAMLQPSEPFSTPQLVRYFPGQKYDLHTDFWPQHQVAKDGTDRLFNRVASFFVFLRDNCTGGETWFPDVDALDRDAERGGSIEAGFNGKILRGEGEGSSRGVRFRPIAGNAIFWVNLDEEGNGDRRVVHAGLPVGEGEKIGMNLWPRKFYGGMEAQEVPERKGWSGQWKQ